MQASPPIETRNSYVPLPNKHTQSQGVKPVPPEEKARLITTYCDRLLRVGGAAEEQRVGEVLGLVVYLKVRAVPCGRGSYVVFF